MVNDRFMLLFVEHNACTTALFFYMFALSNVNIRSTICKQTVYFIHPSILYPSFLSLLSTSTAYAPRSQPFEIRK